MNHRVAVATDSASTGSDRWAHGTEQPWAERSEIVRLTEATR